MNSPLVLIPYKLDGNIYIRELGRAYQTLGKQVIYGFENMFERGTSPEILHLHWPEIYRSAPVWPMERKVERFLAAIDAYRSGGAAIVWTVHNLEPHEEATNLIDKRAYQGVIDRADVIIHHCERSQSLIREKYSVGETTENLICPHGHYFSYPRGITRTQARNRLGIPSDAFVYLAFGNIRGYKGMDLLFSAYRRVQSPNKWLLVAGRVTSAAGTAGWSDRLLLWRKARFGNRMSLHLYNIPDEQIQTFFAASDCVVLSHRTGLNSGVAVLGMTLGRLVIGPDLGCVPEVLRKGGNIIYRTGDRDDLVRAMEHATRADLRLVEKINIVSAENWTWDSMVSEVLGRLGALPRSAVGFVSDS